MIQEQAPTQSAGTHAVDQNLQIRDESSADIPDRKTTDKLLRELLGLIRLAQNPPKNPDTWGQQVKDLYDWIKNNWFLVPILAFLIAWGFYQFNPLYPFAQFKIASDEAQGKLQQLEYSEKIVAHYINQGDAFLSNNRFKEAGKAYTSAKAIDKHNLLAEYGNLKSQLLDFSIAKQFDPEVINQRLEMVRKLQPESLSGQDDPHILYAEAIFSQETGKDPNEVMIKLNRVIELDKNHAPAFALRAELARRSGNFTAAISDQERATALSPYHWEYINNLAYSYQLRADKRFMQGDIEKAKADLENGFALYGTIINLNREALLPQIEVLRLKTLYALQFEQVNHEIPNLIRLFTSEALHELEKNQGALIYHLQLNDIKQTTGEFKIRSWKAKQAYLQQLRLMSRWLGGLDSALTDKNLDSELIKLWMVSPDANLNLPGFLLNDLDSLQRYKVYWGAKRTIPAQKINELRKLAMTGIQR